MTSSLTAWQLPNLCHVTDLRPHGVRMHPQWCRLHSQLSPPAVLHAGHRSPLAHEVVQAVRRLARRQPLGQVPVLLGSRAPHLQPGQASRGQAASAASGRRRRQATCLQSSHDDARHAASLLLARQLQRPFHNALPPTFFSYACSSRAFFSSGSCSR